MCRVCVKSMKKRKGVSGERGNIIYIIIIKSRAEKSLSSPFVPFGILFYVCRNLNCPIIFFFGTHPGEGSGGWEREREKKKLKKKYPFLNFCLFFGRGRLLLGGVWGGVEYGVF